MEKSRSTLLGRMGERFFSENKKYVEKTAYGCCFRYHLVEKGRWQVCTEGFWLQDKDGERTKEFSDSLDGLCFLVKEDRYGKYELIHCFAGRKNETVHWEFAGRTFCRNSTSRNAAPRISAGISLCRISSEISVVKKDCFRDVNPETIVVESRETVIEEGAFFYCGNLVNVQIPSGGRYEILSGDIPGDRFLFDWQEKSVLRYLPSHERKRQKNCSVYLPVETLRIGAGAFSGSSNLGKLHLNLSLMWIGEKAFDRCENFGSSGLRGRLNPDCKIETERGAVPWREL